MGGVGCPNGSMMEQFDGNYEPSNPRQGNNMKIKCADCRIETDWIPEDGMSPDEIRCGDCLDKFLSKIYGKKVN
jgi:DNA-directed RNA polymerase subunit RPC12/RpoP